MKWNYRDNGKRLHCNELHCKTKKKNEYINKEQAYLYIRI